MDAARHVRTVAEVTRPCASTRDAADNTLLIFIGVVDRSLIETWNFQNSKYHLNLSSIFSRSTTFRYVSQFFINPLLSL